jgi:hypothetical protein
MLQQLVTSLNARQSNRGETALRKFAEIVNQVADGGTPSVEQVELALADAGKTVGELEGAVRIELRRRELLVTIADEPNWRESHQKAGRELKELEATFASETERFTALIAEKNAEVARCGQQRKMCSDADTELKRLLRSPTVSQWQRDA